jgi:hypothetical protein
MMHAIGNGLRMAVTVLVGALLWLGLMAGGWLLHLVGVGRR